MPSVRVTCPECDYTFVISDRVVGGLVACRDCKAEFRVEFADDTDDAPAEPERDDRTRKKAPPHTRSRPNVDSEPEAWKTDLPIRSPVPIILGLVGVQLVVALLLAANWFFPSILSTPSSQKGSYYNGYTEPTKTRPTAKW